MKVSVVVTNYNRAEHLGRCLRSCLDQSLPRSEYEVIVVDDASTDHSLQVLEAFSEEIKVVRQKKNQGVAAASNAGIRKALGMYVIRVDADDYVNQHLLLFLSELLTFNKEIGFAYCDLMAVNTAEEHLGIVDRRVLDNLYHHGAGIMFRKSNLEAIGLYDESLRNAEDYDLMKRYLRNYDGYHLKLPLYRYVRHEGNMTNDRQDRIQWNQQVEAKYAAYTGR